MDNDQFDWLYRPSDTNRSVYPEPPVQASYPAQVINKNGQQYQVVMGENGEPQVLVPESAPPIPIMPGDAHSDYELHVLRKGNKTTIFARGDNEALSGVVLGSLGISAVQGIENKQGRSIHLKNTAQEKLGSVSIDRLSPRTRHALGRMMCVGLVFVGTFHVVYKAATFGEGTVIDFQNPTQSFSEPVGQLKSILGVIS